jgi:hypothetical protein
MVTQGNETFVQLHGVQQSGFSSERSNTICVKGTWYPMHFVLVITDGIDAWRTDATEKTVILRSRSLRLTETEYVDKVQLHLGQQHSSSVYLLCRIDSEKVRFTCTPMDKDYSLGFTLDLVLNKVPGMSITFDMLQFVMRAHTELLEQMESKTRMFERTKAAAEKSFRELQKEKNDVELKFLQLKTRADDGALSALSPAGKRKADHEVEKGSVRQKPLRTLPTSPPPSPPSASKTPLYSNGNKELSKSRSKARRGVVTPTKITVKHSMSEPKYSGWGAQAKFFLGVAGPREEQQTAEKEEEEEEEDEEDTDRAREKEMLMAAANVDGCLERSQFPVGDLGFAERHYRLVTAQKGRRTTGSMKKGRSNVNKGSGSKRKKGGQRSVAKKGAVICADQIEDQVAKGIKLLEPFTNSGLCAGWDGEERSQLTLPTKKRGRPFGSRKGCKPSPEKKATSLQFNSQTYSDEVSHWPGVSLQGTDAQQFGVLDNLGVAPVPDEQKKFNVISADFHDFDGDRTENAMALNQFWALYDDKDGMPRFYGRISKLIHTPFEVNVEWLEPYRPVVQPDGLVKLADLSASCGEFKLGSECAQTLAAFSHRVEIDIEGPKSIFRLYPKKGEVWALYRSWWQHKPVQSDAGEEDNVKFEYDLMQVCSDYSKEKGVKVAPLHKIPGFTAIFQSIQESSSMIPAKDVLSRFSHRIFTYRMRGDEGPGVPEDSWELDPAATPVEFLKESPNRYGVDRPPPATESLQTVSESG